MIKSYINYMKKPKYVILPLIKYIPKNKIIWAPFDNEKSNYVKILKNYSLKEIKKDYHKIIYKKNDVGYIFKQHGLYKFLEERKIDWKNHISAKLIPDNAIYVIYKNTMNILEI